MNGYQNFLSFKPPGWNYWFSGSPMGSKYSLNGQVKTTVGNTTYGKARIDQLVADEGIKWIKSASTKSGPFMAALNFYAPHVPAEHPPELDTMFRSVPLPKPPSYNEEDRSDKPRWIQSAPAISAKNTHNMAALYRNRLRSVEYVDRQVARLVYTLGQLGELQNTYIVFYSDNGFHLGEHRLPNYDTGGKNSPYIEDVRFPIVVRGPGIAPGRTSEAMVQNVDLRPTFDEMARTRAPEYVDGASFLPVAKGTGTFPRQYAYSERLASEGVPEYADWKAVYTPDMAYHNWFRTGEEELYDLITDPYELNNVLAGGGKDALTIPFEEAMQRMQDCQGEECRR